MKLFRIMKRYENITYKVIEFQQLNDVAINYNKIKPYTELLSEQKHYAFLLSKYSTSYAVIKSAEDTINCINNIITNINTIKKFTNTNNLN